VIQTQSLDYDRARRMALTIPAPAISNPKHFAGLAPDLTRAIPLFPLLLILRASDGLGFGL
jgi:hypothetical protein